MTIHIDGDFSVKDAECEHYCWPSCHPDQIGPESVYGCRHPAWGDRPFVPIVECDGNLSKCEVPDVNDN